MKKGLFFFVALFCVYSALIAEELRVGLYSGSFDPPTLAHNEVISTAMRELQLDKFIVYVNKYGRKSYKAGAEERKKMLEIMLQDKADRVSVIVQSAHDKRSDYLNLLVPDQKLILVVGEDSYYDRLARSESERFPFDEIVIIPRDSTATLSSVMEANARVMYVPNIEGISSSKIKKQLQSGDFSHIKLDENVLRYISENHLYPIAH